jgi:KDO2-lipid IV(A) lauroyltransferase
LVRQNTMQRPLNRLSLRRLSLRRLSFKPVADWLVYLLVRIFICVVQALHIETCATVSRLLAVLANDIVGLRRSTVDENLRHVFPGLDPRQRRALGRRMWAHLFLMVCEVAHAPRKIRVTNFRQYITFQNKRRLVEIALSDRPFVLVTGHYGNFELGGFITGLLGFPTFTVARTLDNPYLHRFVNRFRGLKGQFILPKQGSAQQVDAVLKSGGALSLLGDQDAGPTGCWVDFLGRPASCHKALALFSLAGDAPLVVAYARRLGAPLHFEVGCPGAVDPRDGGEESASVVSLTRWYNQHLERIILAQPDQYWWVHRRWKGQPGRRRRRKRPVPANNQALPADKAA